MVERICDFWNICEGGVGETFCFPKEGVEKGWAGPEECASNILKYELRTNNDHNR